MTLPKELGDREYQKFTEDSDGNVSVRVGPNAIRDADGNTLAIDQFGKAQTFDLQCLAELKSIGELLNKVIIQLQFITGVDFRDE
jgi:hypothetical protein